MRLYLPRGFSGIQDAIEALVSLGYSTKQARDTISGLSPELNSQQIIKEALKMLAK